jgi:dTDP-4-dehydrorhamnose 3,5-epimerase
MGLDKVATSIPGCYELRPRILADERGSFVKTFHLDWFRDLGLRSDWAEQYYSVSKRRVLRGLHFQLPPHEHAKLVYCVSGEVFDVAVDLRRGSSSFGQHVSVVLSAANANMIYLDAGFAHGFYTTSDSATLVYNVTSVYAPSHDTGIRWDSAGIRWPDPDPIVSARDEQFQPLGSFESPFRA